MDALILLSFIIGGLIIAFVINIITQRNKIKRFTERLRKNFGKIERKEYENRKKRIRSRKSCFIQRLLFKPSG